MIQWVKGDLFGVLIGQYLHCAVYMIYSDMVVNHIFFSLFWIVTFVKWKFIIFVLVCVSCNSANWQRLSQILSHILWVISNYYIYFYSKFYYFNINNEKPRLILSHKVNKGRILQTSPGSNKYVWKPELLQILVCVKKWLCCYWLYQHLMN